MSNEKKKAGILKVKRIAAAVVTVILFEVAALALVPTKNMLYFDNHPGGFSYETLDQGMRIAVPDIVPNSSMDIEKVPDEELGVRVSSSFVVENKEDRYSLLGPNLCVFAEKKPGQLLSDGEMNFKNVCSLVMEAVPDLTIEAFGEVEEDEVIKSSRKVLVPVKIHDFPFHDKVFELDYRGFLTVIQTPEEYGIFLNGNTELHDREAVQRTLQASIDMAKNFEIESKEVMKKGIESHNRKIMMMDVANIVIAIGLGYGASILVLNQEKKKEEGDRLG